MTLTDRRAAILSLVQLAATLTALTLYAALQRRTASTLTLRADRARPLSQTSWRERGLLLAVATVLGVLLLAPIAALVHGALTVGAGAGGNGAEVWAERFDRAIEDSFAVKDESTAPIAVAMQPVSSSVSQ